MKVDSSVLIFELAPVMTHEIFRKYAKLCTNLSWFGRQACACGYGNAPAEKQIRKGVKRRKACYLRESSEVRVRASCRTSGRKVKVVTRARRQAIYSGDR